MEQEYKEIDLLELLAPLKTHWIKILLVAALGGLAAMLVSIYLITPKYEASAMLIVNTREEQSTTVTNDQINSAKNLIDTYAVILKSDTVLNKVIDSLGITNITAGQLAGKISASAVGNTQVMRLTLKHSDARLAQQILQELVNLADETLTQTVKAGSVEIISNAKAGANPVSPNITRNTMLGAAAGLVLALAVVYLRQFTRNTFLTDEDVRNELGLTVLGVIPKIKIEG